MYSVVLATMLTAGAQTTTWCHRAHGCHGCHYNAFSVCSGCHSYCSGCYGGGCWCSGSWCHGCSGWRCSGCWGCSGCWSSCHGCFGGVVMNGCSGCYASGGGVAQGGGGVAEGGRDSSAGRGPERVGRPRVDAPANEAERQAVEDLLRRMREQKKRERKRDDNEEVSAPARVVVKLPAQARLWVDQVPCPLEGTERAFNTPALEPGQRYVYTLRVELERDGRRAEETRRVPLVAGQRVEVDFENIGAVRTAAN